MDGYEITGPTVTYDPATDTLRVELAEGPMLDLRGLGPEIVFRQVVTDQPERRALWLDARQADVLVKMMTYILDRVKISPESREALTALLPEVTALRDALQADVGGDE
jgi:hypothetical protein